MRGVFDPRKLQSQLDELNKIAEDPTLWDNKEKAQKILKEKNTPSHKPLTPDPQEPIDGQRSWLNKADLDRFDQESPLLRNVLRTARKPVIRNKEQVQADDSDTCGRWVAARIMNAEVPLHKFLTSMVGGGGTPDQNVTRYIYQFLQK